MIFMGKKFLKSHWGTRLGHSLALLMLLALGACSQDRKSSSSLLKTDEIWAEQSLCSNNGQASSGCFNIQLNITQNFAWVDVQSLPNILASGVSYRVLARYDGTSTYDVLSDNESVPAGSTFEVHPISGRFIEGYVDWRFETTGIPGSGIVNPAAPGSGVVLAQGTINWPELK